MNPAGFALRRPVTVFMLCLAVLAAGLAASRLLPLALQPDLSWPQATVSVEAPGMGPEAMEREVVRPLEDAIATLPDIERITAQIDPDRARIRVHYGWGEDDMARRNMEIQGRVDQARSGLADRVEDIRVFTGGSEDTPVLNTAILSDRDLSGEYDLLQRALVTRLESLPGVSQVNLMGAYQQNYDILLDPDRLRAFGLQAQQVSERLDRQHRTQTAGQLRADPTRLSLRPDTTVTNREELLDLPLRPDLRLGDVADIEVARPPRTTVHRVDGREALALSVQKTDDANVVAVSEAVRAELEAIADGEERLEGIDFDISFDQADAITSSLDQLLRAGLLGGLLALAVLWFFLRSAIITTVVVGTIPLALAASLVVFHLFGISLNIVSMMGLMLAIGMLVDNAVVVGENIFRLRQQGRGPARASIQGTREIAPAVAAGTLTTTIVFLPLLVSADSQMTIQLQHVAVAVTVTLLASLMLALTVIPLSLAWFSQRRPTIARKDPVQGLARRYGGMLAWCLHRPLRVLVLAVLVAGSIIVPAQHVNLDFMSEDETRQLMLRYQIEGDHDRDTIEHLVDRVEAVLEENADDLELTSLYSRFRADWAQTILYLSDPDEAQRATNEIREQIEELLPKTAVADYDFGWQGGGGGGPPSIELAGPNIDSLLPLTEDIADRLGQLPAVDSAHIDHEAAPEALFVRPRPNLGEFLDFSPGDLAGQINLALSGRSLESLRAGNGETELRVQHSGESRPGPEMLDELPIALGPDATVPLTALAGVERGRQPAGISRIDRRTALEIELLPADGIGSEELREQVNQAMADIELPAGHRWGFGQAVQAAQQDEQQILLLYALGLLGIFLLMASLFESLLKPAAILSSVLFSLVGVWWYFLATGTAFTVMAMIGLLVLMGVVVNNGIVLIDRINQLRRSGQELLPATHQAAVDRFRPILMTVATTVLGLVPLAVSGARIGGIGPSYGPMAQAIIGGLTFSTLVSLIFLPVLYLLLDRLADWTGRLWRQAGAWLPGEPGTAQT